MLIESFHQSLSFQVSKIISQNIHSLLRERKREREMRERGREREKDRAEREKE